MPVNLYSASLAQRPAHIVANLPYHIATHLLIGWLHLLQHEREAGRPCPLASMVLMFQREVAERIAAPCRTRQYGRLSVLAGWLCATESLFTLRPGAFFPPPKVHSQVLRLTPRIEPLAPASMAVLEQVTALFFSQRRKMLRTIMRSAVGAELGQVILRDAGLCPESRPEQVSIVGYCAIACRLQEIGWSGL